MRIHHIGIKVKGLEKNIKIYTILGYYQVSKTISDSIQNNRVAFLSNKSQTIELIEPINELSSVYHFKDGYHHICYEAESGEDIIQRFKKMKIGKIFTKTIVAPALGNRNVVFACLNNGLLIEFIL